MARRLGAIIILICASLLSACAAQRSAPPPAVAPMAEPLPPRTPALPSQEGMASWYGQSHHGKRTANGEAFDMEAMTAAHRSLPFGTLVRVTHLATNREVTVRINDRGPFIKDRIIDLSARSARDLGIVQLGVARVRIEPLPPGQTTSR